MAKKDRPPPPDLVYRDRIAKDLDCTMLVEAAAGTGKTTCLIARMVGLLREGKCRIETLAAVTFTRKAAAELRTRFQLELEKAAREAGGAQRQMLAEALDHVERCFIGTIHSFCARLLRERPVEAGVNPNFVELPDEIDLQLREQAWRAHVANLLATDDPILPELESLGLKVSSSTRRSSSPITELDELGLEPAELGPAFLSYAGYSDVEDWPAQPVPLPDLKPCIKALQAYADHMRSLVPTFGDPGNDELMPAYESMSRKVQRADFAKTWQLMELLAEFGSKKIVQKMWPLKKPQAVTELARWEEFRWQYAEPLLLAWREHRYEPSLRIIREGRACYDRLRQERNGLNFQDLLLYSARLLRDKPEIRRYFRERFTHLLVDEFQDTDPIQAEVMLLMTADDPEETNWQRCRPVPASLFVVGDPKQSIYRFRRADMLTYGKVRAIIEQVGGEVIPLSANFRSVKPVVDWVNGCFSAVLPTQADDFTPADRPLALGRESVTDSNCGVERFLVPAGLPRHQVAEHEADFIARTIRRAIDEKWPVPRTEGELTHGAPGYAKPGDFLIVARSKGQLTQYARKLQQYGVPHAVTGGSVLNEVPELGLLNTCLIAVSRADDPVALVAALRSELFGVADTVLYDVRRPGGRFSYNAELPKGLLPEDAAMLQDAFRRLQTYSRWLRKLPAAAAIERIAADLGLIARACAAEEGDAHAGSFLKTIELLRSVDGQFTLGGYLDALSRLVAQAEVYDGCPVRPALEAPVRVMNLHQCKGLEAPFVFLVDPAGDIDHPVDLHIDRSADEPRGYMPIYGPKRSQFGPRPILAQPPGWAELASHEQRFLDAESNRLLYVAATRAGVKLVISQHGDKKNERNPWSPFDTFLQSAAKFADPGQAQTLKPVKAAIDEASWQNDVTAIGQRWSVVARPTFAIEAIKAAAIKGGPKPHGAEKGGAEWGDVLHTLLEAAMKRPKADLRGLALSALESQELPIALVDDVLATVGRVTASEVWRRAIKSRQCLPEVPIAFPLAAHEASSGLPTTQRGVIDLVFKESAGWVMVDYKSERVGADETPALVKYYQPQIEAYAQVWEKVVGEPVVERGLFFTHTGQFFSA